ncbi:hypothetical protein Trydic_g5797 [Trypoxylus dichotomus]
MCKIEPAHRSVIISFSPGALRDETGSCECHGLAIVCASRLECPEPLYAFVACKHLYHYKTVGANTGRGLWGCSAKAPIELAASLSSAAPPTSKG